MRIAFLLDRAAPAAPEPVVSAVTAEVVARLRDRGARVDLLVAADQAWDLTDLRPRHDLYVLKVKSPLTLSLAGALETTGATVVNTARASALARDKIASTAILAAAGVPVPPSWATGRINAGEPLPAGGALWIKPPRGSRGQGVQRLADAAALVDLPPPTDPFGLPLPLFLQREVPSAGRDLKVYVVGERLWGITRPWPARTPEDKRGTPAIVPDAIRAAARACGRALGLELYGVDFLVANDRFFAVDVNALPGYKGIADAPRRLAEYLDGRARGCAAEATGDGHERGVG